MLMKIAWTRIKLPWKMMSWDWAYDVNSNDSPDDEVTGATDLVDLWYRNLV